MRLLDRLLGRRAEPARPAEAKASRAGRLIAFVADGRPAWPPRDSTPLAELGFRRNPVAHRCVRLVAEAAAALPAVFYLDGREIEDHPLVALIEAPNPRQTGAALLEAVYGHLLVSGNAYVEAVSLEGRPRELFALRPDRMRVVPGLEGWPEAFDYALSGREIRFRQDAEPVPPILHLSAFDPLDDHYGWAPLAAARTALAVHDAASAWNKALLDNAARPSGALVYAGPGGAHLSDAEFERLKEELEASFQGARNAGRPLLLEGGLDWKPLSLSPKDMDFIEAKAAAAREIALALGVPPLLLGLPGDSTYANYQEANRAFYRATVIPLALRTLKALVAWLGPAWGVVPRVDVDLDRVEALAAEREALWRRVGAADFLDRDEKRAAVGWGAGSANPLSREGEGQG